MGGTPDKMAEEKVEEEPTPKKAIVSEVQFAYQPGGPYPSHCGYCHSENEQFLLEGVWAKQMSAQDFQDLVDRGCQRSGKFVYLPANKITCCPQYVLRLDCKTFRISKQQRRVVRRLNDYLLNGLPDGAVLTPEGVILPQDNKDQSTGIESSLPTDTEEKASSDETGAVIAEGATSTDMEKGSQESGRKTKKVVTPGAGPDPNKPPCRKAKEVRREKKAMKQAKKESTTLEVDGKTEKPTNRLSSSPLPMETDANEREIEGTNLMEVIKPPDPKDCKHKLEVKLVCVNPIGQDFWDTYDKSYEVFRKFQMIIHKEPEEKCAEDQFQQFCVETPLLPEDSPPGIDIAYGSYHQQYWIDDNLVMVGVVDIIPKGVLCNYLYYDPKYRFIAPGVYSAVHEIGMNQELYRKNLALQYYYMGYYVHDCPKMNYKRHYHSSYLLCPETLVYVPLETARTKLDGAKYCKFSDEPDLETQPPGEEALGEIMVVGPRSTTPVKYSELRLKFGSRLDDLMKCYVKTVGINLAQRMILYLAGLVQPEPQ